MYQLDVFDEAHLERGVPPIDRLTSLAAALHLAMATS